MDDILTMRRSSFHHPADPRGFTLVEVMLASVVLVTIFLGALTALVHGFGMLDTARNTTLAAQIIQSEIEDLRLQPWTALNARPVDTAETVDLAHSIGSTLGAAELAELSQRFTVTRRFANVAGRTGLDADGTTTIPTFKRVTFTVSWTDYHHRPHTRSYETYLGYRGLSDYFAATHTPNTP